MISCQPFSFSSRVIKYLPHIFSEFFSIKAYFSGRLTSGKIPPESVTDNTEDVKRISLRHVRSEQKNWMEIGNFDGETVCICDGLNA